MMINSVRTLFITQGIPYPPRGGVPLRNWQNINIMKQYGSVGVFSIERGNPKSEALPGVSLWHHCNIDKPFPLSRWEKWQRRFWLLRPYAHPDLDCLYRHAAAQALDKVLTEFQPKLVIFEQLWLYPYLRVVKRHGCRVIFDEHNVEADLFEQKHGALKVRLPRLKAIELDFIRKSNQVWVCSEEDAYLLKNLYGSSFNSYVVPNGINVAEYDCVRLSQCELPSELEEKSHTIIFLGTFSYPPNQVAVQLLIEEIYPQLRQIYPDCRLLLVGSGPNKAMLQIAKGEPGIIVTGRVPDVQPYLAAASVMVAPLLQGGGTRFKILEAFAAGCPVISTAKGAEGLNATDGEHLLIRNEVKEIVEGVSQIWSAPLLREKLTDAAYKLVKTEYSWEGVGRNVEKALQEL